MQRKFTVNGTFIPQDLAGDDMCILFLKYGRCRFKTKCKKSHWVPPLPDEPYPAEHKPPLLKDGQIGKERKNSPENFKDSSNNSQILQTELLYNNSLHHQNSTTTVKTTDSEIQPKVIKNYTLPKRFKHVFHDCNDHSVAYSRVNRLFNEAGAYFDNVTQKLKMPEPVRDKVEKHRLKVLRRIHWRNTQVLKEKLSQYPPSYNLKFDRTKINFTRLRPYVYVLVHECMIVDGENKPIDIPSFEYLIADTLLAYLENECITAQDVEAKLQQWGARAVKVRQCVAHLWHILAISSKSPSGCANEIIAIEEEVEKGTRTSLDYACACAFALKRVKLGAAMIENSHMPQTPSSSIKQGLQAKRERTKRYVLTRNAKDGNGEGREKHETKYLGRGNGTIKHAENVNDRTLTEHAETHSQHGETVTKDETKDLERENETIKHVENVNDSTALMEHAETHSEHGSVTMHAEKVTEYADKANKHAERERKLRKESVEHLNAMGTTGNEETEHAQGKITHVRVPTTHEEQHKTSAQNEKVSEGLKHNLSCDPIRKKRQRSRQFKNVPFNERKRFKTRCFQLLATS